MTQLTRKFAVADPRTFEGDPYEVAERAVKQTAALVALARESCEATRLMVRNADLERQLALTGDCDAQVFEDSPLARKLDKVIADASEAHQALGVVARAVAFNPKARIGR